jgi:N,N'-diacetyl-8-epilegionaminate cytidylyltransferase
MKYVALICARGGSKGVPGKNIRLLAGRPLIGWAIQAVKQVSQLSRIIVSTDSEEIARIAKEQGAEVPFLRPSVLAEDNSPEWLVWRHALDYLAGDGHEDLGGLVVVPPTSPLRSSQDIENCINEYERKEVDVVITISEANRNPYFNMVTVDNHGSAELVISPKTKIFRRQDAPNIFDVTTVCYVARPQFVQQYAGIFEGKVRSVFIPPERSLDIDTELDFKFAEYLITEREIL